MSRSKKILHIVDSECAGGVMKASRVAEPENIPIWLDALHLGPAPQGLGLEELSGVRAKFWGPGVRRILGRRNARLREVHRFREVVLWFGPGVCQLSLIQVLAWLADQEWGATQVSLAPVYVGILHPARLAPFYHSRRPVTQAQLRLAARAWRRYRSANPLDLLALLRQDLNALPHLREALLFQLREYPGVDTGLSRLERLIVESTQPPASVVRVVGSVLGRQSESGCGDRVFFDIVRRLVSCQCPLLRFTRPYEGPPEGVELRGQRVTLTAFGRRVLAGKADYVVANGIDRWIGGVHLQGSGFPWRWDELRRASSEPSASYRLGVIPHV